MKIKMHRHRAVLTSVARCFTACVSPWDCNPMSHGSICYTEECSCGATRTINRNGDHIETSGWRTDMKANDTPNL